MEHTADLRSFGRYASLNVLGMLGLSCYILADTFFVSCGMGANGLAALDVAIPAPHIYFNGLGLMIGVGGATRYTVRLRPMRQHIRGSRVYACRRTRPCSRPAFYADRAGWRGAGFSSFRRRCRHLPPDQRLSAGTLLSFAPFFVMNNVLLAFVRNDGAPGRAMCGMIVGSLSNVVLDYVFIFPCDWGMFGAAFATGLSPIISLLVLSGPC